MSEFEFWREPPACIEKPIEAMSPLEQKVVLAYHRELDEFQRLTAELDEMEHGRRQRLEEAAELRQLRLEAVDAERQQRRAKLEAIANEREAAKLSFRERALRAPAGKWSPLTEQIRREELQRSRQKAPATVANFAIGSIGVTH